MPRLQLGAGAIVLSPREWVLVQEIVRLTEAAPEKGILGRELWPDTSSHDRSRRKAFHALTKRGVLLHTPLGWVVPAEVRTQVAHLGLPTVHRKGGRQDDGRQLRLV